ncbi:hypothetical protein [Oceanobacillus sp. 1P07AA]|uniref:hypothetical protein n=1 Tax=Oceanobacillus sp. 1P07AA TaxID=3132293 RepID=UPI0039A44ED9
MLRCPNCHGKQIGKIGSQDYYCWSCCIELTVSGDQINVNQIESDGSLSSLDDLFTLEERRL